LSSTECAGLLHRAASPGPGPRPTCRTRRDRPDRRPSRPTWVRPSRLDPPGQPSPPRKASPTSSSPNPDWRHHGNGRIIDRFRDRLVFPITRRTEAGNLEPLGFVGRRHPTSRSKDAGPKYLNTPETVLFHKGAQLHAVREDLLAEGATPVLVEGPMDALAVSIAGRGATSASPRWAPHSPRNRPVKLATPVPRPPQHPVVATDADLAGQIAAQRDYWLLAQHGLDPQTVALRPGGATQPTSLPFTGRLPCVKFCRTATRWRRPCSPSASATSAVCAQPGNRPSSWLPATRPAGRPEWGGYLRAQGSQPQPSAGTSLLQSASGTTTRASSRVSSSATWLPCATVSRSLQPRRPQPSKAPVR
jgi:hypothetical protein